MKVILSILEFLRKSSSHIPLTFNRTNCKILKQSLMQAQKEKINAAYKQFFTDMDKLREKNPNPLSPPPPPPPGKKEDIDKLAKARDEQIRSVLNAAQYKKYLDLEKTMRPPMPGQDKKGVPPPVNK